MYRTTWPAAKTDILAMRLLPGHDLRVGLDSAFRSTGATGGFIAAAVGSLNAASLRYAGRGDATLVAGPLEIVALSGTLSPDGPHLHLIVSDRDGRTFGGHLLAGSPIRTTAEIVVGLTSAVRFARPVDRDTGYSELDFRV